METKPTPARLVPGSNFLLTCAAALVVGSMAAPPAAGQDAPQIELEPARLDVDLASGASVARTLTLSNPGALALSWEEVRSGIPPGFGTALDEVEPNNDLAAAQDIDDAFWNLEFDADIGDAAGNTSESIPHVTILGTGDGSFDLYLFTVGRAGARGIFDIDFGATDGIGSIDGYLRLYDDTGAIINQNDDFDPAAGGGGSTSGLDSFLEHTFAAPGTYFIEVGTCCVSPVGAGGGYSLQVSLQDHPTRSRVLPDWLVLAPRNGSVAPGGSQEITVSIDSLGLVEGSYSEELEFVSNDPARPTVNIPVALGVTGFPEIAVSPASLNFGNVLSGVATTVELEVANPGTAALTVSAVTSDAPAFVVGDGAGGGFTVPPGEMRVVPVVFTPDAVDLFIGTLTIASDDADEPTVDVPLAGRGLAAPRLAVDPPRLEITLTSGDVVERTLTVSNPGEQTLNWVEVRSEIPPGFTETVNEVEPNNSIGFAQDIDEGFWSLEPDPNIGDQNSNTSETIPHLTIEGTGDGTLDYYLFTVANAGDRGIFDIDFGSGGAGSIDGHLILYNINGTEIARNDDASPAAGQGGSTSSLDSFLEFVFSAPGTYIIEVGNCCVSPVAAGGTYQLQVSVENHPLSNTTLPDWLSLDVSQGTVAPGAEQEITVSVDSAGLIGGDYSEPLIFSAGRAGIPDLEVAVDLQVIGVPEVTVAPAALDFGGVLNGNTRTLDLVLSNPGTGVLTVSAITSDNPAFSADAAAGTTVDPGASQTVEVTFAPDAVAPFAGVLTVLSDDAGDPEVTVDLAGEGLHPPQITVDPLQVTESLVSGDAVTRTITVSNGGLGPLDFSLGGGGDGGTVLLLGDRGPPGSTPGDDLAAVLGELGFQVTEVTNTQFYFGFPFPPDFDAVILFDFEFDDGMPVQGQEAIRNYVIGGGGLVLIQPVGFGADLGFYDAMLEVIPQSGMEIYAGEETLTVVENHPVVASLSGPLTYDNLGVRTVATSGTVVARGTESGDAIIVDRVGDGRVVAFASAGKGPVEQGPSEENHPFFNADMQAVLVDTLTWVSSRTPAWVSTSVESGTVASGGALQVEVTLDAADLFEGVYTASLFFRSNDVEDPSVEVQIDLDVSGDPIIAVTPGEIDFGNTVVGASAGAQLVVANAGTAAMMVESVVLDGGAYALDPAVPEGGLVIPPATEQVFDVTFAPASTGRHPGSIVVRSDALGAPRVEVRLDGVGLPAPAVVVDSAPAMAAVAPGTGAGTVSITVRNDGVGALEYTASALSGRDALGNTNSLEKVLQNLNDGFEAVTSLVPARFDFSEGENGVSIGDGGSDMYDGGNFLGTNLTEFPINYSDDAIGTDPALGPGGSYFTRKFPGLFVFGGNIDGVDTFEITGNLGADGGGSINEEVVAAEAGGVTYVGFVKSVFGTSDPSVNHLVIVPLPELADPVDERTLVSLGSTWRYLDDGSDQGEAWRDPEFSDVLWASGPAQLGYGDGDERTVVSFGGDSNNKHITTYFRHRFTVTDLASVPSLTLDLVRDDGVVVYLNGEEVLRDFMPGGAIDFQTPASQTAQTNSENNLLSFPIPLGALVEGENVFAVEIHQRNGTSSDISFDLGLRANAGIPGAPGHSFSNDTDDDDHTVFNLAGLTRIYYLLYASADGGFIGFNEHQTILETFLEVLVLTPSWLLDASDSGTLAPGEDRVLTFDFDASELPEGVFEGTVNLATNDPLNPNVEVPVILTVGRPELVAPPVLAVTLFPDVREERRFQVANDGLLPLTVTLEGSGPGFALGRVEAVIPAGGAIEIPLLLDTRGLAPTGYSGSIQVTSDDPSRPEMEIAVDLTVQSDGRPATSGIPDLVVFAGVVEEFIDLHGAFEDVEDDDRDLRFTVVLNTGRDLIRRALVDHEAGRLILRFVPGASGEAGLRVRATDTGGRSSEVPFRVVVGATDDDGDGLADGWELSNFGNLDSGAGDDPDGDGLDNAAEFAAGSDPLNADTDGDGIDDGQEAALGGAIVGRRQLPPAHEDAAFSFEAEAARPPGAGSVTVSAAGLPGWLAAGDAGDGVVALTGTPGAADVGTAEFSLQVDWTAGDGVPAGSLTERVQLEVRPVNDAPTTTGADPVVANAGTERVAIDLRSVFDDEEDGPDGLSFRVVSNTADRLFTATPIDPETGELTLFIRGDGAGDLAVRATDSGGRSVQAVIRVTVDAPPAAGLPRVTVDPGGDEDADGLLDSWELEHFASLLTGPASDPDGDGVVNAAEAAAGTDPADPGSFWRVEVRRGAGPRDPVSLRWAGRPGFAYRVEVAASPAGPWSTLAGEVSAGADGFTVVSDPGAAAASLRFYRVVALSKAAEAEAK